MCWFDNKAFDLPSGKSRPWVRLRAYVRMRVNTVLDLGGLGLDQRQVNWRPGM